jgi:RNA polymerase sigma factor (sigma-70 family)
MDDPGEAAIPRDQVKELAADLVQDTFEAAAIGWAALRAHPGDRQRAWLLGTLAHKDISDLRHRATFRRKQSEIHARYTATPADTEAQALNAIALARAREIIECLPPRQREIALMRWRDRMRATEIAAALGIAEGTVHAQTSGPTSRGPPRRVGRRRTGCSRRIFGLSSASLSVTPTVACRSSTWSGRAVAA